MIETEPVSNYTIEPEDEILGYPFERPSYSFVTDGETIQKLSNDYCEFSTKTDEYLAARGLPLLSERLPIVAYGSNSNPARLKTKMDKYGGPETEAERQTVPNIIATIPDNVVAWHGKPGQGGGAFAELYKDDTTIGQETACHVSYLTEKQLALMHVTEGVTYHLTPVEVLVGTDKTPVQAFAYTAGYSHVLLNEGAPVSVLRSSESINAADAMDVEQAINYMVSHTEAAVDSSSVHELIDEMKGLPLSEKKVKQENVRGQLQEKGLSKPFSYPDAPYYLGRAAFDFHGPQNVRLMEQVVAPMRPDDIAQRGNGKTDIAQSLRQRAHTELADRIKNHSAN